MGMVSWSVVNRGFYIGLAIGQIFLTVISTAYASMLWILGQNPAQVSLIAVGVGLVGLVFLAASLILLRDALRLPAGTSPETRSIGKKVGRRFGLVALSEGVIIGAITTLLSQTNHGDWSIPVIYFIVGLHFFPLAFVFRVRSYLVLGLLWVVISLLTVILTPASLIVGQGLSAWVFFPIAGCGVATWPVVAYVIRTSMRKVHHVLRLPSPVL
ncbi:MAG TPA: hypothetical protein VGM01_07185 [Ktedonobacteraceae bacterium]